jgi:hypothetical protein
LVHHSPPLSSGAIRFNLCSVRFAAVLTLCRRSTCREPKSRSRG